MKPFRGGTFRAVSARLSARLHLGFLDLNGGLGRRFGSIGLSISAPSGDLTLSRSAVACVSGVERQRASRYLQIMQEHLKLPGPYDLRIDTAIAAHAGLGSGTQLALGVAAALRQLNGLARDTPSDLSRLERGARSGVGAGLFESGGFVVDGGRGVASAPPPVLARLEFPPAWRIVLVMDRTSVGVHGQAERNAFKTLAPMPQGDAAEICRVVLMQVLPSLVESDIVGFGAGIAWVQRRLGDYFAPAQGGQAFASAKVASALRRLADAGAHGVGQSSWGPTGFAFAADAAEAERLARIGRAGPDADDLDILVVSGNNQGCQLIETGAAKLSALERR